MTNEGNTEKFDFTEEPKKVINYRACFGFMNYFLLAFFLICTGLLVASLYGFFQVRVDDPKIAMSLIVNAGFFGMFSGLFFSLWKFNFLPLSKSKILIFESSVLFSSYHKEYSLYFEDIEKVDHISFLGFSRLMLRTKDGDVLSYSMWLNNSEYVLDAIYNFNSELIGKGQFDEIRRKMVLSGQSLERLQDLFSREKIWITLAHILLAPLVFGLIIKFKQSSINIFSELEYYISLVQPLIFSVVFTSGLYFVASNIIINNWMLAKHKKEINSNFRDKEYEQETLKKYYPWYASTLAVLLLLTTFLDINLYSLERVAKSSVDLNILKGENVWVDRRYNCISCAYSLKENDVISFYDDVSKKKKFAKIKKVSVEMSRIPASIQEKGSVILVRPENSDSLEYVPLKHILGKKL